MKMWFQEKSNLSLISQGGLESKLYLRRYPVQKQGGWAVYTYIFLYWLWASTCAREGEWLGEERWSITS